MLRQQRGKDDRPTRCLADFVAPSDSGLVDSIGAFAVTAGIGCDALVARYEGELDDYQAIMVKALADRLAEAFAEYMHLLARRAWGFGESEDLSPDELIGERYRGIRPALGYPACPDHSEKPRLFDLLDAESLSLAPYRQLRGDTGRERVRPLLRASRSEVLQRRKDRFGSGRGLRAAKGSDPGRGRAMARLEPGIARSKPSPRPAPSCSTPSAR